METNVVVDQNRSRCCGKNKDHGHSSSSGRVFQDISRNFQCGDGILPTPYICGDGILPTPDIKTPVGKLGSGFSPSSGFNKTTSAEGKSSNRKSKGSSLKKGSSVPFNIKVDCDHGSSSCRVFRNISRNFQCGDGILPTPDIKTCKTPVGKLGARFSPSLGFNKTTSAEGNISNRKSKGLSLKKGSSVPFNINVDCDHGSSSCRVFRDISRNFQCGDGILPTPDIKTCKTPVGKLSSKFSPSSGFNMTTSTEGKSSNRKSKGLSLKKGSSVPFNIKVDCDKENYLYCKKLSYSERWAGPAYSNSPPPSSLPMPKFSVTSKRSVSLELACLESEIHLRPTSRSAPPSPKREHGNFSRNVFHGVDHASATKDLCRILNLDMTDE